MEDEAAKRKEHLEHIKRNSPGGQLSAQDAFLSDPPGKSAQGPLEVVRLTREKGGRGVRRA